MPSDWSSDVCRSEEHTSELQSHDNLVCRLLLEKKKKRPRRGRIRQRAVRGRLGDRAGWRGGALVDASLFLRALHPRGRRSEHLFFFFFNDPATPEIYPLPFPDALPI